MLEKILALFGPSIEKGGFFVLHCCGPNGKVSKQPWENCERVAGSPSDTMPPMLKSAAGVGSKSEDTVEDRLHPWTSCHVYWITELDRTWQSSHVYRALSCPPSEVMRSTPFSHHSTGTASGWGGLEGMSAVRREGPKVIATGRGEC